MKLKFVRPHHSQEGIFAEAESNVADYFTDQSFNPENGTIEISGERYILVRSASMSVHFLDFIRKMYPSLDEQETLKAASKVLYDMAHTIGKSDAKAFHQKMNVKDPIARMSTGPVHFSFTGWAYVEALPESHPTPDDDYYIVYDHRQSFEADAWLTEGRKTDFCTCFMGAGYSAGWTEESIQLSMEAREIQCRAKGDPTCRFIMSRPYRIEEFIDLYCKKNQCGC